MPNQASLNEELSPDRYYGDVLDEVFEDLEDFVGEDNFLYRIERGFSGDDVFVQTDEYNVFVKDNGLTFHGLDPDREFEDIEDPVLEYLEELFDADFEIDLNWY